MVMANGVAILRVATYWYCPNKCGKEDITFEVRPHIRFHACPKLGMVQAPLVPQGTKAKVIAVEREDYVGRDDAQYDDRGRAIMAVVTVRDDGQDVAVLAPTARARVG